MSASLRLSRSLVNCASKHAQVLKNVKAHVRTQTTAAASLRALDNCLEVDVSGQNLSLNYVWLRDNCRAENSFSDTNQRVLDTAEIDLRIKPVNCKIEDNQLLIEWPDRHLTKYDLKWLVENSYNNSKTVQPRLLWNADIIKKANLVPAQYDAFMSSDSKGDSERKKVIQNILQYGIALVEGVPATEKDTEEVVKKVSMIRETTYGRTWTFTSDNARGDSAYTQEALDRHTDTTYLHEPCGIQVFHCLKHEGTGGRTLLVDGFYAAEKLRARAPEQFEMLTQIPIKHEYVESKDNHKNHLQGIGPVLEVYPWNKELYMIRYNNYDRSVIDTVPHDQVQRWYVAHRELTKELRRPENDLYIKLLPGTVLFIDNWRVLHGREAFTGHRMLSGCYLTRDDVLNAARGFGLLN